MMTFLSNTTWWLTLALATAAATLPLLLKSLRMLFILPILALWFAAVISMGVKTGILAAFIGGVISLLWGFLLMMTSLLFSGVRQMAKKRYG